MFMSTVLNSVLSNSVSSLSSELLHVLDLEFPKYSVKKYHFQQSSTVNALINNLLMTDKSYHATPSRNKNPTSK